MNIIATIWRAACKVLRGILRFRSRSKFEKEMDTELRDHVELKVREGMNLGMTEKEARVAAIREFGSPESIRDACRDETGITWVEQLLVDARSGVRQLAKNPGFSAVIVLTLALGIGANTAIFSVINGVLLKPLPYPHPEQLVTLWERNPQKGIEQDRVSGPTYLDWRDQSKSFVDLSVSPGWEGVETFNLVLRDSTTKVRATYCSASLFSTLGMKPLLGRVLEPDEDRPRGNRAAVIGYDLWQRYFGGDHDIIGKILTLDTYGRRDYTIVGVMPAGFGHPGRSELWLPLGWMGVTLTERRVAHWHNVIARLKPGVTLAQAQAEMNTIQKRIAERYSGEGVGPEVAVIPMLEQALGRKLSKALMMLWAVVGCVLLIACANIANLMLARTAVRQREIAVRLALGAGRGRIIRQLLVESLILALIGGGVGLLFGWWGLHAIIATNPGNIPRLAQVELDTTALLFTFGVVLVTGVLFGLAPALQFSRPDLNSALKDAISRTCGAGKSERRTRNFLVVAEVAISVALLASAGFMLDGFQRILRADRGFQSEHLLTVDLDFSVSGYTTWVRPTATRPQVKLQELIARVRTLPGVTSVAAASRLMRRDNQPPHDTFSILGWPSAPADERPRADFKGVTPDWVNTLGGRVLRGRDFTDTDILEAPGVVMINETLARRYFPNDNPIGKHFKMGSSQPPLNATNVYGLPEWSEIVGIVSDVKSLHPQPESVPEVYVSSWQWPMQSPILLVRSAVDANQLAGSIRRELKNTIPNLPPPVIKTMDGVLMETFAQPRLQARLLTLFAALALMLSAVGLYGVLNYSVTQRTREIGLRVALGAKRDDVMSLVMHHGMGLVAAGIVIGGVLAVAASRVLRGLLYGNEPSGGKTLAIASIILLFVGVIASWLPARRATKVEPMVALREE